MTDILILLIIFSGSVYLIVTCVIYIIKLFFDKRWRSGFFLWVSIIPWLIFSYKICIQLIIQINNFNLYKL